MYKKNSDTLQITLVNVSLKICELKTQLVKHFHRTILGSLVYMKAVVAIYPSMKIITLLYLTFQPYRCSKCQHGKS